jgi:hypothetical protein
MLREVALLDADPSPDLLEELGLVHDLAVARDEDGEDVDLLRREAQGRAPVDEQPSPRVENERAE